MLDALMPHLILTNLCVHSAVNDVVIAGDGEDNEAFGDSVNGEHIMTRRFILFTKFEMTRKIRLNLFSNNINNVIAECRVFMECCFEFMGGEGHD